MSTKVDAKRFDAVGFMRDRRKRIGNETEGLNFLQLKKYFGRMTIQSNTSFIIALHK